MNHLTILQDTAFKAAGYKKQHSPLYSPSQARNNTVHKHGGKTNEKDSVRNARRGERFGFITVRIGENQFDQFYRLKWGFRSEGRAATSA